MATPRILLVSRHTLEANADKFKEHLAGLNVQMAVAVTPEDAEAAKKLTDAVAQFQYVTAIVADFEADMAINDDGSTELLGYTPVLSHEPPIITEA
jgi:molybdopterin/thiamine biosynthesis adenylyltransferase